MLWTAHPFSWPNFSYTSVSPDLMAFLGPAHDLCIAWHDYGGQIDKYKFEC